MCDDPIVDFCTEFCSYDHPHVIAGQGTIGLEIAEQVPDVDVVVVPVGGGGLIAGISLAIKNVLPNVTVIVRNSERIGFPGTVRDLYTPTGRRVGKVSGDDALLGSRRHGESGRGSFHSRWTRGPALRLQRRGDGEALRRQNGGSHQISRALFRLKLDDFLDRSW